MHAIVNIALRAARDAAEAIAHSSDRLDRVKVLNDAPEHFMTSMDKDANRTVLYHLQQAYPDHSYHSRVSGLEEGSDKSTVWHIDPLLGSQNFAVGYTQFAVSIACVINGKTSHAVVVNPLTNEEFTASRGGAAQLNGRRIRVGDATSLDNTLIGLQADHGFRAEAILLQQSLLSTSAQVRVSGSAPLDMLAVASGRLDAGWSAPQNPLSIAASRLILTEAGGLIGDRNGNPSIEADSQLIYANPRCFKAALKLIA